MSRSDITALLSKCLERHLDPRNDPRVYWAKEITFDYTTGNTVRVDYMRYKPVNNTVSGIEKGDFYCYEIKSSVADFKSKNGHNFVGDYNYYVMPSDVFEVVRDLVPYDVGVFVPDRFGGVESVHKARRKDRDRPTSEMLLMMYRSARRELVTVRRVEKRMNSSAKPPHSILF